MEFLEMVERRRSTRSFTEERVSCEATEKIIRAALLAPSSKNTQSSSFMIVEDKRVIGRMSEMRDYGSAFMAEAPLVILVLGDERLSDLWRINASISASYLQLAAESMGLGSCWVHVDGRPHRKDEPDGMTAEEYLKEFIPVPEGMRIMCAVAVGHPAGTVTPVPKKVRSESERVMILDGMQSISGE